jgi:transposase
MPLTESRMNLTPLTRTLQRRVNLYLQGKESTGCLDWNHGPWRPKLVPHDKVQQLVRDSREGESWGKEEVRKLLEEQAGRLSQTRVCEIF